MTKRHSSRKREFPSRLVQGMSDHYRDARHYDHFYARRKEDIAFYSDLVLEHGGEEARVLELGVGTGRVALAIADRGPSVVGVDRMAEMLTRAEARLAKKPARIRKRIRYVEDDIRTLRLGKKFDLVISPFNVFMHLYTREDLEETLKTVKRHLLPDGRLIFDVMVPDPFELARPQDRVYQCGKITHPETRIKYKYSEQFRYDPLRQVQEIRMRMTPIESKRQGDREIEHLLIQRQFFPSELSALLHYNGLEVEHTYGDFERRPLCSDDESQILVCRRLKK